MGGGGVTLRIAYFGTPASAAFCLNVLLAAGHRVVQVVTRPDRPSGRSRRSKPPPVKEAALHAGLPVIQPERIRGPAFRREVEEARPDVLVVVAYGKILPPRVIEIPPLGAVNLHFSLLPRYRGAAPVQWALARGERTTGVTTMRISKRLDEGDILLQKEVSILPGEHTPSLEQRLAESGAPLLLQTLDGLRRDTLAPVPQDASLATYAPSLKREDGLWRPDWLSRDLEGKVRGFDPWPGVWARNKGRRIRITDAASLEETRPGEFSGHIFGLDERGLLLACSAGSAAVVRGVQVEGRRPLSARDAVNGRILAPGDRLEPLEPSKS